MGASFSTKSKQIHLENNTSAEHFEKAFDVTGFGFNKFYISTRNMIYSMNLNYNQSIEKRLENMLIGINQGVAECFEKARINEENIVELVKGRLLFRTDQYNLPNIELENFVNAAGLYKTSEKSGKSRQNYETTANQNNRKTTPPSAAVYDDQDHQKGIDVH